MHFFKNFDISDENILIYGKSPNAGTSGTTIKNLNTLDNLINYDTFSPGTVSMSSSNQTSDIAAGTGARQVTIFGLENTTYLPITETLTLHATDGRIAVTGTKIFYRVFAAEVILAGSGKTNVGDLYIYTTGTALTAGVPTVLTTTWVKILLGEGGGSNGLYTVPANKKAVINKCTFSNRTQIATYSVFATSTVANNRENIFQLSLPATAPVYETDIFKNAYEFAALTDLYIRITPAVSLAVGNGFLLLQLKNI